MTYRTDHRQRIAGIFDTSIELSLSTEKRADDLHQFDGTATFWIATGAVRLQTYATAEDLRALAYACLRAAIDLDAIARESQPLEVAA